MIEKWEQRKRSYLSYLEPRIFKSNSLSLSGSVFFVVILSLLLHLFYLYENNWGSDFVSAYLQSDAYYYFHKAWFSAFVVDNGGMLSTVIPFSPYISFLTLGFKVFGTYLWVPFLINSICIALTSAMLVLITQKLFNTKIALIAGALSALCGTFIFFSGLSIKSGLELFFTLLALYFSVSAIQKKSYTAFFFAITTFSITAYDRDNIIILIFPLLICFLKSIKDSGQSMRLHAFFALFLALLSFLSVKFLIGYIFGNHGVNNLLGVNFYVGNAPGATGGYTPIHGIENDIIGLRLGVYQRLMVEKGAPPDFFQLHWYLIPECLNYYLNNPFEYFLLKSKHLLLLLSQYSYGHPEQYAFWQDHYQSTTIAFIDWRYILGFCGVFIISSKKSVYNNNIHLFMWLSGFFYAITIWVFLVTERYRLPLYVIFIPYAAWGIRSLMTNFKMKPVLGFILIFGMSTFLNTVMVEGAGWSNNTEQARSIENEKKDKNRTVYLNMQKVANDNNFSSMIQLADFMAKQGNCKDANSLLLKALSVRNSKYIHRLLTNCDE